MIQRFEYDHFYIEDEELGGQPGGAKSVFSLISTDNTKELIWKSPFYPDEDLDLLEIHSQAFVTNVCLNEPLTTDELVVISHLVFTRPSN